MISRQRIWCMWDYLENISLVGTPKHYRASDFLPLQICIQQRCTEALVAANYPSPKLQLMC